MCIIEIRVLIDFWQLRGCWCGTNFYLWQTWPLIFLNHYCILQKSNQPMICQVGKCLIGGCQRWTVPFILHYKEQSCMKNQELFAEVFKLWVGAYIITFIVHLSVCLSVCLFNCPSMEKINSSKLKKNVKKEDVNLDWKKVSYIQQIPEAHIPGTYVSCLILSASEFEIIDGTSVVKKN